MSTDLHKRMLEFNYGDDERAKLMREVWLGHPWMVDAFSGGYRDDREYQMLDWCYETFGQQASPIHKRPGAWLRGSATVHGWTWFGFTNEADMLKLIVRWPSPTSEENAA